MEFLKGDGDGGGFEAALVSPFEASLAIAIRSFLNAWDPKNGQNSQFTIKSTKTHKLYNSFNSSQTNPHPIDLDLHHNQNPEKKNLFFQKFSSINKKEKEREYRSPEYELWKFSQTLIEFLMCASERWKLYKQNGIEQHQKKFALKRNNK